MKQTILGVTPEEFSSKLTKKKGLMIAVAAVTAAMNLLFCLLRTDSSHTVMLILNIAADILGGSFLIFYGCTVLAPAKKRLRLWNMKRVQLSGTVEETDDTPRWHWGLACTAIRLGRRSVFIPEGLLPPRAGQKVTVQTAMNMAVEVEVHEEADC